MPGPIKLVVLDTSPASFLDITGYDMLEKSGQQLSERGITLKLANVSGPMRDVTGRAEFKDKYGISPSKRTIAEAIDEWKSHRG